MLSSLQAQQIEDLKCATTDPIIKDEAEGIVALLGHLQKEIAANTSDR
jgi:hypothetical protein